MDVSRQIVPDAHMQIPAEANTQSLLKPANPHSHVNKVIAVVSGKGGVGKSMVTASLARIMREQGFNVGIMDADITGPSIPKMYGIHKQAMGTEEGIIPEEAKDGTKIMSVNLLLPNESIRLYGEVRSLQML